MIEYPFDEAPRPEDDVDDELIEDEDDDGNPLIRNPHNIIEDDEEDDYDEDEEDEEDEDDEEDDEYDDGDEFLDKSGDFIEVTTCL